VEIDDELWSVKSLFAPWLRSLSGNQEEVSPDTLLAVLFPCDDLIRVFSYWLKAQAFHWPSQGMYGLTSLCCYHFEKPTGPMDALTHPPWKKDGHAQFQHAGKNALKDLASLSSGLEEPVTAHLECYIRTAKDWNQLDQVVESRFKKTVSFQLAELAKIFENEGATVENSQVQRSFNCDYYCPPYGPFSTDTLFEPAVKFAMQCLAHSAKEHKRDQAWEVVFTSDEPLSASQCPGTFPYLFLVVCLTSDPDKVLNKDAEGWFKPGHHLFKAKAALKGCGQWFILTGTDGRLQLPPKPVLGGLDANEAHDLWNKFNCKKQWNVLHILKLGMPVEA